MLLLMTFQWIGRISSDAEWAGPRLFISFENQDNVGRVEAYRISRERVPQDRKADGQHNNRI